MNGIDVYDNEYMEKIENLLEKNNDLCLEGYANFIQNASLSTVYSYTGYIVRFLRNRNKALDEIRLDDYTAYLASLKKYTPSYQIAVYSALKMLSSYCVANGYTVIDFMAKVTRPKFKESKETKERREKGYLTKPEIGECLANVRNGIGNDVAKAKQKKWRNRDLLLVKIFLNTGMRCAALYKLDVESIDFTNKNLITIDKGGEIQEFPLDDNLLNLIQDWMNDREEMLNGKDESALFLSNRLTRMSRDAIADVIVKYSSTIEDKRITPHKLRATYGTQIYEETRDIYLVKECMAHSNPAVTSLYIRGQKNVSREKGANIMANLTT